MKAETVGITFAALSSGAAATSAYISRQAVDRAHRAFVWPTISFETDSAGRQVLRVQLHNDGPGTAYDVRWSVGTVTVTEQGDAAADHGLTLASASPVVRALRPAEACPPHDWFRVAFTPPPDDVWSVLVRWTDAARVRWEVVEQGPATMRAEPRRVRTWRWQAWRPRRDW